MDASSGTIVLSALGMVALILKLVVQPLLALLRENTKAQKLLADGMGKVAKSNEKIAVETKALREETRRGNEQSEKRNGHLGELIIQQGENTKAIADATVSKIIEGVQNVKEQKVDTQIVKSSNK